MGKSPALIAGGDGQDCPSYNGARAGVPVLRYGTRGGGGVTILGVRRLLYLGIALAGLVCLAAWGMAFGVFESVDGSGTVVAGSGALEDPHPRPLSRGERGERDGKNAVKLAQFEGRRWQRGGVDLPAPVVVVPVVESVPMVQWPAEIQLAGVLVGSTPESGSAFFKIGSGAVETVRIGQGPKARPEMVVTEISREGIIVRYQGQLFPLKVAVPANPVLRRAE